MFAPRIIRVSVQRCTRCQVSPRRPPTTVKDGPLAAPRLVSRSATTISSSVASRSDRSTIAVLYVFNKARLTAAPLRFGKHWAGLFDRWRFPWRRMLLEAKGKPAQAFGVALHQNGNIMTLLLAGEGNQPSDILGGGDSLLLDLDDDITRAQSGLRRSTVCHDLRHDDTVTRRVIATRQTPAGADSGGRRK